IFSKIQSGEGEQVDYNKIVGKIVFYILLVIVFIVFFNLLNLDMIATPLSDLVSTFFLFIPAVLKAAIILDRKSTRLNSSHVSISYAVFCLKKKILVILCLCLVFSFFF